MKNESKIDRIVRVMVGIILIGIAYSMTGAWSIVLYVIGGISLITAATGFCLLYKIFGYSTNK